MWVWVCGMDVVYKTDRIPAWCISLSPKEVFEMVAKPKRNWLQRRFDEVFSDMVTGLGR